MLRSVVARVATNAMHGGIHGRTVQAWMAGYQLDRIFL